MNTKIMKKAWEIRKAAAAKYNCNVMDVMFGICIEMAMNGEEVKVKTEKKKMTIKEKGILIDRIIGSLNNDVRTRNKDLIKQGRPEEQQKLHGGDTFFKLAFKTDSQIIAIAKLARVYSQ